jgi:hypothetical protein
MQKHALKLFLLGGAVLAAVSLGKPALAADNVVHGEVCAVLTDSTGTRIEVFDTGTARVLQCHHAPQPAPPCPPSQQQPCPPVPIPPPPPQAICHEAFAVCAGGSFAVGAIDNTAFNLKVSDTCKVFLQEFNTDPDFGANLPIVTLLTPELLPDAETGAPVFNLDDLPLGTVVNVQVVNQPNGGSIGVQTTFQHRVGTCKLCKIRKFFATSPVTITSVKEIDVPCNEGIFSQLAGPGGSDTGVVSDTFGQFITLTSTGNTEANPSRADQRFFERSLAGSIEAANLLAELKDCGPGSLTADRIDNRDGGPGSARAIAVFLSFRTSSSSGVTIRPGFDKFLTFCIDIE